MKKKVPLVHSSCRSSLRVPVHPPCWPVLPILYLPSQPPQWVTLPLTTEPLVHLLLLLFPCWTQIKTLAAQTKMKGDSMRAGCQILKFSRQEMSWSNWWSANTCCISWKGKCDSRVCSWESGGWSKESAEIVPRPETKKSFPRQTWAFAWDKWPLFSFHFPPFWKECPPLLFYDSPSGVFWKQITCFLSVTGSEMERSCASGWMIPGAPTISGLQVDMMRFWTLKHNI